MEQQNLDLAGGKLEAASIAVTLFGGLRLHLPPLEGTAPVVVERFETRRVAALLAYLALYPDRDHPREHLAEMLWPDEAVEATRLRLRHALSSLRRTLEPAQEAGSGDLIVADRVTVRLAPGRFIMDALAFERHLRDAKRAGEGVGDPEARRGHLQNAVALYTGDLLPELYDSWAVRERERYAIAHLEARLELAASLAEAGDYGGASTEARRAVEADPLREDAHRALIGYYAAAGRTADALRQYSELESVLERELSAHPSPETTAFIERIRRGDAAAASPRAEVAPAAIPVRPAPPLAAALPPSSVPAPLTRFFGREMELGWLEETLAPGTRDRLVTLTGIGGAGKTRLAQEAAALLAPRYEDAAWFIPLTEAHDPLDVARAIAGMLRLPPVDTADPRAVLLPVTDALRGRPALLVLDNFEQVVETSSDLVRRLLEGLPRLACLVTSRQRLEIGGEREMPVGPLPTPFAPGRPEHLLEFPAVQLFVDRARAARPGFALTRDNAAAVARICQKLEGMPLAIDLVAAWSAALAPAQMLARLEEGEGEGETLLTSRARDRDSRHRSLRAALAGSIDQLPGEARRFFARLSVFRGGWSLEAAGAVTGMPRDAFAWLLDLQRRSLVVSEEGAEGAMRFRLLETVRVCATEHLEAEGDEAAHAARREHLRFFTALAVEAEPQLVREEQGKWLSRLDADADNMRAALAWSVEQDVEGALVLGGALMRYWRIRGQMTEGRRWLGQALAHPAAQPPRVSSEVRARALNAAGSFALIQSDYPTARAHIEEALALRREANDDLGVASCLNNLAGVMAEQGELTTARGLLEESLKLFRAGNDTVQTAHILSNLGDILNALGEIEEAHARLTEALALRRMLGNKQGVLVTLNRLADVQQAQGDYASALACYQESLALAREIDMRPMVAGALCGVGLAAVRSGDLARARVSLTESLAMFRDIDSPRDIAVVMDAFAFLAAEDLSLERAATLMGAAEAIRTAVGVSAPARYRGEVANLRERISREMGRAACDAAFARGGLLTSAEAVTLALRPGDPVTLPRRADAPVPDILAWR